MLCDYLPSYFLSINRIITLHHLHFAKTTITTTTTTTDKDGQFRYTPPTHAIVAFHQALKEFELEGGIKARAKRYISNQQVLMERMKELQFELYLHPSLQGHIISSYKYPQDKNWNFHQFYRKLNDKNYVIYPGKVSSAECFRIGHIGRLKPEDTINLCVAIDQVCQDMKTAKYYTS